MADHRATMRLSSRNTVLVVLSSWQRKLLVVQKAYRIANIGPNLALICD